MVCQLCGDVNSRTRKVYLFGYKLDKAGGLAHLCILCISKLEKTKCFIDKFASNLSRTQCKLSPDSSDRLCNLCGHLRRCKFDKIQEVSEKISDLVGYEVDKLDVVCRLCAANVSYCYNFKTVCDNAWGDFEQRGVSKLNAGKELVVKLASRPLRSNSVVDFIPPSSSDRNEEVCLKESTDSSQFHGFELSSNRDANLLLVIKKVLASNGSTSWSVGGNLESVGEIEKMVCIKENNDCVSKNIADFQEVVESSPGTIKTKSLVDAKSLHQGVVQSMPEIKTEEDGQIKVRELVKCTRNVNEPANLEPKDECVSIKLEPTDDALPVKSEPASSPSKPLATIAIFDDELSNPDSPDSIQSDPLQVEDTANCTMEDDNSSDVICIDEEPAERILGVEKVVDNVSNVEVIIDSTSKESPSSDSKMDENYCDTAKTKSKQKRAAKKKWGRDEQMKKKRTISDSTHFNDDSNSNNRCRSEGKHTVNEEEEKKKNDLKQSTNLNLEQNGSDNTPSSTMSEMSNKRQTRAKNNNVAPMPRSAVNGSETQRRKQLNYFEMNDDDDDYEFEFDNDDDDEDYCDDPKRKSKKKKSVWTISGSGDDDDDSDDDLNDCRRKRKRKRKRSREKIKMKKKKKEKNNNSDDNDLKESSNFKLEQNVGVEMSSSVKSKPSNESMQSDKDKVVSLKLNLVKGTETKPSLNLDFKEKKQPGNKKMIVVSVDPDYVEKSKTLKPQVGDGGYFILNDKFRSSDRPNYKRYVMECIENVFYKRVSLMPYLKGNLVGGEQKLSFKCFICGTVIFNKMLRPSVISHLVMHMLLLCPFCDDLQMSIADMLHHLRLTHVRNVNNCKFKCKMCGKEICRGPELYFNHLKTHFKLYYCEHCKYSSDDVREFEEHCRESCHQLVCTDDCSISYNMEEGLMDHLKEMAANQDVYKCNNCLLTFHTSEQVSAHFDIHGHAHSFCITEAGTRTDKQKPFYDSEYVLDGFKSGKQLDRCDLVDDKCPICHKNLKESDSEHIRKHLNFHYCLVCRACDNKPTYSNFQSFKNHILNDHTLPPLECKICTNSIVFSDVDLYSQHALQHI